MTCNSCKQIQYNIDHPEVQQKRTETRNNWTEEQKRINHEKLVRAQRSIPLEEKIRTNKKRSETRKNKTQEEKDEITAKTKATKLKNHGDENYNNREQAMETCFEHFGVNTPMEVPEIKQKAKRTCKLRYGVEYPSQNPDISAKIKNTNQERYGVDNPSKLPEIISKIQQTDRENHGGVLFAQTDEFKQLMTDYRNSEQGKLVKAKLQSDEYKEYMREINLLHPEWHKNARVSRYFYDNILFDSMAELAFYIKCIDENIKIKRCEERFEYNNSRGDIHFYEPDFIINENQLVEIKGDHLIPDENGHNVYTRKDKNKTRADIARDNNLCKFKLMKELNVKIILYSELEEYINYINEHKPDLFKRYKLIRCIDNRNKPTYWSYDLLVTGGSSIYFND